jgi:hypothetical protein
VQRQPIRTPAHGDDKLLATDFVKYCIDEGTDGLERRQKAGETRSHDAHFHALTAPTFVQEQALICALIPLPFLMLGAP